MQWTDRIRQMKILLVAAAVMIAVASLLVSHFLIRDLASEERHRMEVWAEAMRSLNMADENTDLNLVLKVINENNTIPVIVLDSKGEAQTFRNVVGLEGVDDVDSLKKASKLGREWLEAGNNIKIELGGKVGETSKAARHNYIHVCYDESPMLKRLAE